MSMNMEGYMENAQGAFVPIANVKEEHKAEDQLVRDLIEKALLLQDMMAQFKDQANADVDAFMELLADKYKAPKRGKKGNVSFQSYDGRLRVEVQVSDQMEFGPELQIAKTKIDEFIEKNSDGASDKIRTLVNDAFQVNKAKTVDRGRVLGLRRLDMGDDPDWAAAMEAISNSVKTVGSKSYIRFYRADPAEKSKEAISLDLAKL